MKVLGISFGRNGQNCDLLVKHALMNAEAEGAEVKFINTVNMKINHCIGCGSCSRGRDNGKQIKCILKDDYLELENEVLDADGIIVAAPVYILGPTGQFKNFVDRFGPAHDRAAALAEQEKRRKNEADELLDPRVLANKYVAYISVGGAYTPNWVSLGLPTMSLFGMSTAMKTVGHIDAYNMGRMGNPLLNDNLTDQVEKLAKHLVASVGKPYDQVTWMGETGICPVCHNKLITIGRSTTVECPICGIEGKLSIENEEVKVTFSDKQKNRARNTPVGLQEHYDEITTMKDYCMPILEANKDRLPSMLDKYRNYKPNYTK